MRADASVRSPLSLALVAALAERVSQETGIEASAILGHGRTMKVTAARHRLMAILWADEGFSFPEIAALLERDHSTILAGVRKSLGEAAYGAAVMARCPWRRRRVAA